MPPQREKANPLALTPVADAIQMAFPFDRLAKELIAHAPILALIIKNTVPETADMTFKDLVRRLQHPSTILAMDYSLDSYVDAPANLENTEMDGLRADVVVTLKIRDDLIVRVNVEAQNKPHPGYSLDTRSILYDAALLVDQVRKGWIKGSNYDGLRKVYSIWLISNAAASVQGRIVCHSVKTTEISADGTKRELLEPNPGADKLCAVLAYLPDPKRGVIFAEWLSTMGVLLGNSSMAERKQALKKHGIVLEPNFEAKVKKMCTLSQGLIEKGYEEGVLAGQNEVQPKLKAIMARNAEIESERINSDNRLKRAISIFKSQGMSLAAISEAVDTPIDVLQKLLLQSPSETPTAFH